MVIFHSYVSLPEGIYLLHNLIHETGDKISWQFQTSSNLKGDVSRFQATFG